MKKECGKFVWVLVLVAGFVLQGCGGSGQESVDGSQNSPVDLSQVTLADVAVNPPSTKSVFGLYSLAEEAGLQMAATIEIGRNSVTSEQYEINDGRMRLPLKITCEHFAGGKTNCVQTDDDTAITSAAGYEKNVWNGDFSFDLANYFFENKCGRVVRVDGSFNCKLTQQFSGTCKSSNDSDKKLEIALDNELHKIDFDLTVGFVDDTMNLTGIVSIDGTNYKFEDLEKIASSECN